MPAPIGLYIHVPFCVSKCPYCDFYSRAGQSGALMEAYTAAVARSLEQWRERLEGTFADTLYFGGGTPSLLGGERISRILSTVKRLFGLEKAEITMEANPGDRLEETFLAFASAGGNRVSLGMQSADRRELGSLGRRHRPEDIGAAVSAAHAAGIDNVSLDLMLGIEHQTAASVKSSIQTTCTLGAKHISAYLLKIEEGTPYNTKQASLALPDEEATAELYLTACETLEALGYRQYEISNFARPGYESRHNLKYWNADPYLGIGPSAHSFLNGRRFYYPRNTELFIKGAEPEAERGSDENGPDTIADASEEEYVLLRLRLAEGVTETGFLARFGYPLPLLYKERATRLPARLVVVDRRGIRLTREGFLLSNPLTARIIG